MPEPLLIEGESLTLEDVERVALERAPPVALAGAARERMLRSRAVVERAVVSGKAVYGVNSGFGRLADVAIPPDHLEELQLNLIRSHACGVGEP
ncbi:hypothetical protein BH20GEM2_BH20GEM2_10170 [soil metagenome]